MSSVRNIRVHAGCRLRCPAFYKDSIMLMTKPMPVLELTGAAGYAVG